MLTNWPWPRRPSAVEKAMLLGRKNCHIVTKDWLEDSINKKRKLPEWPFMLYHIERKKRQKEIDEARRKRNEELEMRYVHPGEFAVDP